MTELSLYTFIESVVDVIPAVSGRFAVLEGSGNDLNADNNDEVIVINAINQQQWKKKYPCAVLMPPIELGRNNKKQTTRYRLTMYFLTTTNYTSNGLIKKINPQTNTSQTSIKEDWSEMRSAAEDFRSTMNDTFYNDLTILEYIRPIKNSEDRYERVSMKNNDRLSGVMLTFELDVVMSCSGSGSVPSWTPPNVCRVCDPTAGTEGQVWTILPNGTVGFADPTGDGSGSSTMEIVVIEGDGDIGVEPFKVYDIPNGVLTLPTLLDLSHIVTEGSYFEIYNMERTQELTFSHDVYRYDEAFRKLDGASSYKIRLVNGKFRQ